jgi:hypothetical protein
LGAQIFAMRGVVLQVWVVRLYRKGKFQVGKSVLVRATHSCIGGEAAKASKDANICAGVPSKIRPHPPENSVSPQNSTGA